MGAAVGVAVVATILIPLLTIAYRMGQKYQGLATRVDGLVTTVEEVRVSVTSLGDRIERLFEKADERQDLRVTALESRLAQRVDRTDALIVARVDDVRHDIKELGDENRRLLERTVRTEERVINLSEIRTRQPKD